MSWIDQVDNPEGLRAIYHDPPPLSGVSIHEFVMHRDGPTLRMRLDLTDFPADAPRKWRAAGFNTVQIELLFVGVGTISLNGLSTEMVADIDLRRDGDIVLVVESPAMRLTANCDSVTISRIGAYCDAREDRATGREK